MSIRITSQTAKELTKQNVDQLQRETQCAIVSNTY